MAKFESPLNAVNNIKTFFLFLSHICQFIYLFFAGLVWCGVDDLEHLFSAGCAYYILYMI